MHRSGTALPRRSKQQPPACTAVLDDLCKRSLAEDNTSPHKMKDQHYHRQLIIADGSELLCLP